MVAVLTCCTVPARSEQAAEESKPVAPGHGWGIRFTDGGGFQVFYDRVPVVQSRYVYWGDNWNWSDTDISNKSESAGAMRFNAEFTGTDISIKGAYAATSKQLDAEWAVHSGSAKTAIGGGLEFSLRLDPGIYGGRTPTVELLNGKVGGFELKAAGETLRFAFTGVDRTYFEMDSREQVRVFFYDKRVPAGERLVKLRMGLPEGTEVLPSLTASFGKSDPGDWHEDSFDFRSRPVDLSKVLTSARRKDGLLPRVRAQGMQLVREDGTPIQFFGTNIASYSLFYAARDVACRESKRLASFGFNLARIHHHDSKWVQPNVFGKDARRTTKLDPDELEKIDWWIKCLNEAGLYVWLDLHVGRVVKQADGIEGFEELKNQNYEVRGVNYVNPTIERRMHEFAEQYLDRKNKFTGRRIADDPGVVAVLVTNENDLMGHFFGFFGKEHPKHRRMYIKAAQPIATKLGLGAPAGVPLWEFGPAKGLLSELERSFFRRHEAVLQRIGLKALRVTTHAWGENTVGSVPSMLEGDIADVHSYGNAESLHKNPRHDANFIHWIGAFQTLGKPIAISEWNVPFPNVDRFVAPLYVAAIASLQGWDAPMLYAWTQNDPGEASSPEQWAIYSDPVAAGTVPAAAVMLRDRHLKPSQKHHVVQLSKESLFADTSPRTSRTLRTLVERSLVSLRMPDSTVPVPKGATVVTDLDKDFVPPGAEVVESDTGEIRRDWGRGLLTINTPKSQAAVGVVGGAPIKLDTVRIESLTQRAAIAFTALDNRPLNVSQDILVTALARGEPVAEFTLPFKTEPVVALLSIDHQKTLQLIPLSRRGRPRRAIEGRREPGKTTQTFELPNDVATHWYRLRPKR